MSNTLTTKIGVTLTETKLEGGNAVVLIREEYPRRSQISDGYHTFDELYDHRIALFLAFMHSHPKLAWWSRKHEDGTMFEGGWLIVGMTLPAGAITYHIPDKYIPMLQGIRELEYGKPWDGHTPADVVERILDYVDVVRGHGETA